MLPPDCFWHDVDGPITAGWWAMERGGERLALLQPFQGHISVRFYLSEHPWHYKDVTVPRIGQAKRFAERWLLSRLVTTTS